MNRQRIVLVRSVSLSLVGLLLFLAGWGHTSMGQETVAKAPVQKTGTAQKADKATPADRANAPADTQVSTSTFEAVVTPATSFEFGETVWLLPPPVLAVLLLLAAITVLFIITEPYFYFAYFRHIFGHFIAPNAP